jgi:serine palmitoyltransferase
LELLINPIALSKYGCGSCGPRGFYGTIDARLDLGQAMVQFCHTEGAILYSNGASCAASTVADFARRGDFLVFDEGIYEALESGVTPSRANIRYFKYNDMQDLKKGLFNEFKPLMNH